MPVTEQKLNPDLFTYTLSTYALINMNYNFFLDIILVRRTFVHKKWRVMNMRLVGFSFAHFLFHLGLT